MSEWQPIKTAPKDGTTFDIWSPEYGRLTNYIRVNLGKGNVFFDPYSSGITTVRCATHWMPIPEPPK